MIIVYLTKYGNKTFTAFKQKRNKCSDEEKKFLSQNVKKKKLKRNTLRCWRSSFNWRRRRCCRRCRRWQQPRECQRGERREKGTLRKDRERHRKKEKDSKGRERKRKNTKNEREKEILARWRNEEM